MPLIFDAAPPAIIQPIRPVEKHFGISYGLRSDGETLVEYDRVLLPKDFRDANWRELVAYLPSELQKMPPWALQGMLFTPVFFVAAPLIKTTTFIISTSAANQTWSVLANWNGADNNLQCISHGGQGGQGGHDCCGSWPGGGGGGGGFAKTSNVGLTPSGSMTFHLEAGGQGAAVAQATWANGATLAASSAGICGAGNAHPTSGAAGLGGSTVGAQGTMQRPGGDGDNGGGGAAGATGNGGTAVAATGGTGDGGTTAANTAGTQYDATHGSGGGGNGGGSGSGGPLYGGGGGGAGDDTVGGANGAQALIVTVNNASL